MLGTILAALSWAALAGIIYLLIRMLSNGTGWIYLN
jgi:hypothetical protein